MTGVLFVKLLYRCGMKRESTNVIGIQFRCTEVHRPFRESRETEGVTTNDEIVCREVESCESVSYEPLYASSSFSLQQSPESIS